MAEQEKTGKGTKHPGIGKRPLFFLLLMLLLGGACIYWVVRYANTPGPPGSAEAVVMIQPGASFDEITLVLAESGLIDPDIRFHILARWSGLAGRLRAGEFVLQTGMLPLEVLEELSRATPRLHPVTIAEGLNAREIAAIFVKGNWCTREEFLRLVHDAEFISSLGLDALPSLEGYLYPDTYYLTRYPAFDAEKIVKMMVGRFLQVWDGLEPNDVERHQVVVLASIVEKETGDPGERARIASVFKNRLKSGMRLQSDPTAIYGIENFSGNITGKDLRNATPYNTYVIAGLPPGPICNPGKAALEAVLYPAEEDYLYFVSKNDGSHQFSKSLKEHNRAVFKYQRKRQK